MTSNKFHTLLKTHDINIKTYLYIMLPLIQVFIGLPIINYIDNQNIESK
jgi:hypothetical protein